ncbi:alpha/beta hydrolase [Leptospira levettii]|uniref:Alpha/beta hydrolase n=1 Tax=Leptospira levettii TaxID=2023178 RepID=A0ABY2MKN9_9LEPT|nr:alpha/beta hydrolase [Leptospira levettii]MCG6147595.1 alpha/beta hydrolase [Leptospira levettii]TGL67700.1 alpha/beta hydrolase [Leptospira levettii]
MTSLEIIEQGVPPEGAQGILILWPSTGGNARSFRIRDSELIDYGLRLIRFNPPSHGDSTGTYDPKTAITLLDEYLKKQNYIGKPLYGIGHSGGGAALLLYAKQVQFQKLFLLSPILNSVKSLEFLYESKSIEEFSRLLLLPNISDDDSPNKQILETLSTSHWLETGKVNHLSFPVKNTRIQVDSLAEFLQNLFLPGFQVENYDFEKRTDISIFLPAMDKWFPKEYTSEFAKRNHIRLVEILEAPDHFFSQSWLSVWKQIKSIGWENKESFPS